MAVTYATHSTDEWMGPTQNVTVVWSLMSDMCPIFTEPGFLREQAAPYAGHRSQETGEFSG